MDQEQLIMIGGGVVALLVFIIILYFIFKKPIDNFTVKTGRYAPGFDLEVFDTTDINKCAEKVLNNPNAGNFAFNGNKCYIKSIVKDDAYTGVSDEWNTYVLRSA